MERLKKEILAALKAPRAFGFSGLSKPQLCEELQFASASAISEALRQMRKAGQVWYGGDRWNFLQEDEEVPRDQPKRYVFADTPLTEVKQLVIMALGHIQGVPKELRSRRQHFNHYRHSDTFALLYSRDIDCVLGIPANDLPSEQLVREAIRELRGDAIPFGHPEGRGRAAYVCLSDRWRKRQLKRYGDYHGYRPCTSQTESCSRRAGKTYCRNYVEWKGLWNLRWQRTWRPYPAHPRFQFPR